MFVGIDRSEILNCLNSRHPISTGSVRHVTNMGRKNELSRMVCRLIPTDSWIKIMNTAGPKRKGVIKIMWALGENVMFSLEFHRSALKVCKENKLRTARVRVEQAQLLVYHGPVTKRIPLSRGPEFIEFGKHLEIIPISLYEAAAAFAAANPEREPEPESSVA